MHARTIVSLIRCGLLAAVIASLMGTASPAAVVTWGTETDIAADTDVSTTGTLVRAFHFGSDSVVNTTVNGVLFEAFFTGTGTIGNFAISSAAAASTASMSVPFDNLSAAYQALLGSAAYPDTSNTLTLTMSGLTVGQEYQFQTWVNDSVGKSDTFDYPVAVTAGNTAELVRNTTASNADGGLGQFVIGTFVADAATQTIEYSESEIGPIVNAFQLRQLNTSQVVPEPASALAWLVVGACSSGFFARRRRSQPVVA